MIKRRTTLAEALGEIEAGTLAGVTAIVVSGDWWHALDGQSQGSYRKRCSTAGIVLRTDTDLSRHFVELATDPGEPPLSTERVV